jgi:hypothetical protein
MVIDRLVPPSTSSMNLLSTPCKNRDP